MLLNQVLTPIVQLTSVIVAAIALCVAWKNLRGLQRSQTLQAQMSLISLENEVRKNHIQYKAAVKECDNVNDKDISSLVNKATNAFEIYITSADKLAALINADYLRDQFPGRDWKKEYSEIFQKVKYYHQSDDKIIPGKEYMVRNIDETLKRWKLPLY
ncbi:MAG: hypothetical protein LBP64_04445 [Tannerella sp.]|jgi:hypothetical protein|nr:hypothetical protein [Tannerella sp.]